MINEFEDLDGSQDLRNLNGSNGNGLYSSNGHVNGSSKKGYDLSKVADYIRENPPRGRGDVYRASFSTIFAVIRKMNYPVKEVPAELCTDELFERYNKVKNEINSEVRNENSL